MFVPLCYPKKGRIVLSFCKLVPLSDAVKRIYRAVQRKKYMNYINNRTTLTIFTAINAKVIQKVIPKIIILFEFL